VRSVAVPRRAEDRKNSEISSPTTPITIRMIPMVEISRPEMSALTAKYRIAPMAMRKSEVPIPIGC
jgi:hypothetical protein